MPFPNRGLFFLLSLLFAASSTAASPQKKPAGEVSSTPRVDVAAGIYGLFQALLERDGHQASFNAANEKSAAVCFDWDSVKLVRTAEIYEIRRYWVEWDEASLEEMRRSVLEKCEEYAHEQEKPCVCFGLSDGESFALEVPQEVNARLGRTMRAFELVSDPAYRKRLERIAKIRKDRRLLSEDSSSPYKILEAIQKQWCDRNSKTAKRCSFDRERCLSLLSQPRGIPGGHDSEVADIACSTISTSHETPGVFEMLWRFHEEILTAAKLTGLSIDEDFAFGSLPINQVNVTITDEAFGGARIMVFNLAFFSFAYEMAKVAALSLPFDASSPEAVSYDMSEEALVGFLESNPDVEANFADTVLTFLGYADRPPIPPSNLIQPMLMMYTQGMEIFAMAHEVGHSVLRHRGGGKLNLEASHCSVPSSGKWLAEVEADYIGIELLKGVKDLRAACTGAFVDGRGGLAGLGRPLEHCESHPFSLVLPLAPEFYFLAREIAGEGCAIIEGSERNPDPLEEELISFAKKCRASRDCDFLEDLREALPRELLVRVGHPHPSIRRRFAEVWVDERELSGFDNPISTLGNSLTRNSQIIWDFAKQKMKGKRNETETQADPD